MTGRVFIWRIENFSHWHEEVHGHFIGTPSRLIINNWNYTDMQLYPKGIDGRGEHVVVRISDDWCSFSGELSFYASDGGLLGSKQQVNKEYKVPLELTSGPKFHDVLFRKRVSGDFITVILRTDGDNFEQRMSTTINVVQIQVKIKPGWIEKMGPDARKEVCFIDFSSNQQLGSSSNIFYDRMSLKTCSKNNTVNFFLQLIGAFRKPCTKITHPLAVKIHMSLTGSDGTVHVRKERLVNDFSPLALFPDPLEKEELVGKRISIFFIWKTRDLTRITSYYICDDTSCVSIELTTPCYGENPIGKHVKLITKDSESQTLPDEPVVEEEAEGYSESQTSSDGESVLEEEAEGYSGSQTSSDESVVEEETKGYSGSQTLPDEPVVKFPALYFIEWTIHKFSLWNAEVFGDGLMWPLFGLGKGYAFDIELYPKNVGGQGEYPTLRLILHRGINTSLSGDLSLTCNHIQHTLPVNVENEQYIRRTYDVTFEDLLSAIREGGKDLVVVTLRINSPIRCVHRLRTSLENKSVECDNVEPV